MAKERDIFSKDSSRVSLFDRVKNVGHSLRNMKPADVAFMAANVAVGVATKTLVVGSLAAAGVTASTILGGAAVAVAGGAAVGVARVALSHVLKRSEGPVLSRENLKKVALGSAISVATFGALSGAEAFSTHTEIGEKIAGKLTSVFNTAKGWLFGAKPAAVAVAPVVAAPVAAGEALPEHCEILKLRNNAVVGYRVDVGPSHPNFEKINSECGAKWGDMIRAERGIEEPVAAKASLPAHSSASAPVQAQASHHHKSGGLKKALKALVGKPADVVVPHEVPASAPVSASASQDVASEELKKVLSVTSQAEMDEAYAAERMSATIQETTGVAPDEGATVQDMAAQIHPENPDAYLKAVQQQAPQLDKAHLAAVCKTSVPKEFGDVPPTVTTDCTELKETMGDQDIVTVRDVNHPDPKKGIRALWRGITKAVSGTKSPDMSTVDFISKHVGGPGGVVEEMTESAKAEFLNQTQAAQLAPQ